MRFVLAACFGAVIASIASAQQSDPCAQFVAENTGSFAGLNAKLFRQCIQNVPFSSEKATGVMANVRKFMGLNSASVYFVDPTPELELQAFNVNKTMDGIDEKIKSGAYKNNWSFDSDVVQLFQMFRDGHTDYETVCTHGYMFIHDYPLTSIATGDGLPELYHVIHDFDSLSVTAKPQLGSKVKKINGQDPQAYMADFIKNSPEGLDWIDPDARYNSMLTSYPGASLRGRFAYRNMWNGEDLTITWENGTTTKVEMTVSLTTDMVEDGALLFTDTESLTELCFKGISRLETRELKDLDKRQSAPPPAGYPTPDASSVESAMVSYSLPDDKETAVLVVRTLESDELESAKFVNEFSNFMKQQVAMWRSKGYKRLIIDVTSNPGGKAILPYEMLKQLFPKDEDFLTVNMQYSPVTWAYIQSVSNGDEYTNWHKVDGSDFAGMVDFLGPVVKDGGLFTKMWQQDYRQFGEELYGLEINNKGEPPFSPENIVIVSDSLCASACHSLVESLRALGVRAFAYGGRASQTAPMQAVGGTKGGKFIDYEVLRKRLDVVAANASTALIAGPAETWTLDPLPINMKKMKINMENKFRKGFALPLQFVYTPACNRFFLSQDMFGDITKLWEKTRDIAWDSNGAATKCVDYEAADNNGGGDEAQAENAGFEEGVAVDGSELTQSSGAQRRYRNIGQLIWLRMGRKDR